MLQINSQEKNMSAMVSKEQTHLPWVGKRCGEVKMSRHYGVAMGLCHVGLVSLNP